MVATNISLILLLCGAFFAIAVGFILVLALNGRKK